jgi:hypothetical protein
VSTPPNGGSDLGKRPTSPRRADLSFLASGPPKKTPEEEPPPAQGKEPEAQEPPEPAQEEGSATPTEQAIRGRPDATGRAQAIVVYVPIRTRERLKAFCTATGRTYTDVVLDAVEELDAQLGDVFAQHLPSRSPGGLFSRRTPRRPRTGEPGVQIPLRMAPDDLTILDARVEQYAEANRSLFVRVVLDTYLDKHG